MIRLYSLAVQVLSFCLLCSSISLSFATLFPLVPLLSSFPAFPVIFASDLVALQQSLVGYPQRLVLSLSLILSIAFPLIAVFTSANHYIFVALTPLVLPDAIPEHFSFPSQTMPSPPGLIFQ